MLVDETAVALEVCVENDPAALPIQQFGERVRGIGPNRRLCNRKTTRKIRAQADAPV